LRLSGDTPHSGHLVTLRPGRSDQDEKRSVSSRASEVAYEFQLMARNVFLYNA
jgi:hypothetical protein